MKYAAVIVTYNRKELLVKNIDSLLKQTLPPDEIYVIDNNSTDGTEEYLEMSGIISMPSVRYHRLTENIGGSGGFYVGTKAAYEANNDFICLMDDDGRAADNRTMEILLEKAEIINANDSLLMLNSLVVGDDEILSFGLGSAVKKADAEKMQKNGLIEQWINPFNGTLISKKLIENIGYPNKEFFIKGDEQDYIIRARKVGAYIATVTESIYYHPVLKREYIKLLGKERRVSTEAPWKEYYRSRNYTYMFKRDKKFLNMLKQPLRQIAWAIIAGKEKTSAVKLILIGFKDGLLGHLGAQVKP